MKLKNKDPKKTKGFGCIVMKAPYYNLGLMHLSSRSITTITCCRRHHQWTGLLLSKPLEHLYRLISKTDPSKYGLSFTNNNCITEAYTAALNGIEIIWVV